jgi:hypothetical protein
VSQGCDQADGSVAAHAEIPDIIEEDYGRCRGWIEWFAEKRADNDLRSARFADNSRAEVIKFLLETIEPSGQISFSQVRATSNDNACRFPLGVRVDYGNAIFQ